MEIDAHDEHSSEIDPFVKREPNGTKRTPIYGRARLNGLRAIGISIRNIYMTDGTSPSKTVSIDRRRNTVIPTGHGVVD